MFLFITALIFMFIYINTIVQKCRNNLAFASRVRYLAVHVLCVGVLGSSIIIEADILLRVYNIILCVRFMHIECATL